MHALHKIPLTCKTVYMAKQTSVGCKSTALPWFQVKEHTYIASTDSLDITHCLAMSAFLEEVRAEKDENLAAYYMWIQGANFICALFLCLFKETFAFFQTAGDIFAACFCPPFYSLWCFWLLRMWHLLAMLENAILYASLFWSIFEWFSLRETAAHRHSLRESKIWNKSWCHKDKPKFSC